MELYFFTDNSALTKKLEELSFGKKYAISVFDTSELKKACRTVSDLILVYIDIEGFGEGYEKDIQYLSKKENIFFGIIDVKGKVIDIARLFFSGAVDYIRKIGSDTEITQKRIADILSYLKKYRKDFIPVSDEVKNPIKNDSDYILPQKGWSDIISGNEYAFAIMFIEIDGEKELEKQYGVKNFKKALATFIEYIKRHTKAFDGRIWFWSSAGGIILFPFDGATCPAVLCGFRLKLFKQIYDVEESLFASGISFRIALHIGNVTYFTGDTGEIISDTINSVFHLGKNFAEPDSFCLTDEVYSFAPPRIKDYFIESGNFEGRTIMRMKKYRFGE
ncbi:MAG: hypothetical protein JXJ04_18420 [Spirochaetales bacterium]|nr:hypothetical protein [Spirochaetales bacterium]